MLRRPFLRLNPNVLTVSESSTSIITVSFEPSGGNAGSSVHFSFGLRHLAIPAKLRINLNRWRLTMHMKDDLALGKVLKDPAVTVKSS